MLLFINLLTVRLLPYIFLVLSDKVVVKRPSFINLEMTSLIDQPITLFVQNISGHTVKEIQLKGNDKKSNFLLPLSFAGDSPFAHNVVGKMADGTPVFINGRELLAIVPSMNNKPVPLFLSNKGLYFINCKVSLKY